MPLDPFLTSLVPTMTDLPDPIEDFAAWRVQDSQANDTLTAELTEPGPPVREIHDVLIPVADGTINLRIYYPAGEGPHPVHLYLHGGGWFGASVDDLLVDTACRERAVFGDCVVVAVNYRKAPEHRFPTGLNDCYTALCWIVDHAGALGVRSDLVTVSGQSAGANLAAALTLKARDHGGPAIVFQLLEVPALDLTLSAASMVRNSTGYGLTATGISQCVRYYLNTPEEALLPYASPLLGPDLSGLPPAHIMSAEYDPLCDDGSAYATRLTNAGVPATFSLQHGHIHTSNAFTKVMNASRAWRQEVATVLHHAHHGNPDRAPSTAGTPHR